MSVTNSSAQRRLIPFPRGNAITSPVGCALAALNLNGDVSGGTLTITHELDSNEAIQPIWASLVVSAMSSDVVAAFEFVSGQDSTIAGANEFLNHNVTIPALTASNNLGAIWGFPQCVLQLGDKTSPYIRVAIDNPGAGSLARLSVRYLVYQRNAVGFVPFGVPARQVSQS